MAYSLEDYYNTGDDNIGQIGGAMWEAQVFTASSSYSISRVSVKIFVSSGDVGTITLGIRATSSSKPTGADLTSATLDDGDVSHTAPGAWADFDLTPYSLTNGVEYAVVIRVSGAGILRWRLDSTSPSYAGGTRCYSLNSGSSWTIDATVDNMFETYSGSAADYKDVAGTSTLIFTTVGNANKLTTYDIAGTATMKHVTFPVSAIVSSNITNAVPSSLSKLVAVGNDSFWYES